MQNHNALVLDLDISKTKMLLYVFYNKIMAKKIQTTFLQ